MSTLLEKLIKIRTKGRQLHHAMDNNLAERQFEEAVARTTYIIFKKTADELMALAFSKPYEDKVSFVFHYCGVGFSDKIQEKYGKVFFKVDNSKDDQDLGLDGMMFSKHILGDLLIQNEINYIFDQKTGECRIFAYMDTMTMREQGPQMKRKFPE